MPITWPEGKRFAFTIFDDTDLATIANVKPVYDLLTELGFKTTKSVWPITLGKDPYIGGSTCDDPEYLSFVRDLQSKGFEIGSHLSSFNSASREETLRGLEAFKKHFGHYPRSLACHDSNAEGIYWGGARLSGVYRVLYNAATRFKNVGKFRGHVEGDPHFWGDICRDRVDYVRNFVYKDINTLARCPEMPYHDPQRPYVKQWFAGSDGFEVRTFCRTLSRENVDRLVAERGACIMYTHFGCGFVKDGKLDAEFADVMGDLATRGGWYVPVSQLLDYLAAQRASQGRVSGLRRADRARLERTWLWEKVSG